MPPERVDADGGVFFGRSLSDAVCVEERPNGDRFVRRRRETADADADADTGSVVHDGCTRVLFARVIHALPTQDVVGVLERALHLLVGEIVVARDFRCIDLADQAMEHGRKRVAPVPHHDARVDAAVTLVLGEVPLKLGDRLLDGLDELDRVDGKFVRGSKTNICEKNVQDGSLHAASDGNA